MTLDCQLKKMGFIQTNSDPCLYTSSEGELFIIAVYVDDILFATKSSERLEAVKKAISAQFEVKYLGELHYILGVTVNQNPEEKSIWIGQPNYVASLLEKYGMRDAKPIANTSTRLVKATEIDELVDKDLYQSAVGSLQYLSTITRPDITFAVSNVSKFCSNPTKQYWIAVKRIMRYLKGTQNHGLLYKKVESKTCVGFSDSGWAGDHDDRKSTSGYFFSSWWNSY